MASVSQHLKREAVSFCQHDCQASRYLSFWFLLIEGSRNICCRQMVTRMRMTRFLKWVLKGWNALDLISHIVLLLLVALRLAGFHVQRWNLFVSTAACLTIMLWSKMLFFMMPFQTTGASCTLQLIFCNTEHVKLLIMWMLTRILRHVTFDVCYLMLVLKARVHAH